MTFGTVASVKAEQLGAMLDQSAIFLVGARQKARHVDKGHNRDIKGIAKTHEARRFARGIAVEDAGENHGLIGDEADRATGHAAEPDHDIPAEVRLNLEKITFVHDFGDQFLDVIGFVGVVWNEGVE